MPQEIKQNCSHYYRSHHYIQDVLTCIKGDGAEEIHKNAPLPEIYAHYSDQYYSQHLTPMLFERIYNAEVLPITTMGFNNFPWLQIYCSAL